MGDAEGDAARFVMPVTQHNHGPVLYHCGESLETRRRQQVGWNDGNPSSPQVFDDGVQNQWLPSRTPDLLAPRESVGRGGPVRAGTGFLQVAHDGAGDPQRVAAWIAGARRSRPMSRTHSKSVTAPGYPRGSSGDSGVS